MDYVCVDSVLEVRIMLNGVVINFFWIRIGMYIAIGRYRGIVSTSQGGL